MTDDELRRLVRDAVLRQLGQKPAAPVPVLQEAAFTSASHSTAMWASHPSHFQYVALVNATDACVIEPSVGCDHCGYCKSQGH